MIRIAQYYTDGDEITKFDRIEPETYGESLFKSMTKDIKISEDKKSLIVTLEVPETISRILEM